MPRLFEAIRMPTERRGGPERSGHSVAAPGRRFMLSPHQRSLHEGTALLGPFAPIRRGEGQVEGSPTWPWRQTLILSFSPRTGRRDLGAGPLAKQALRHFGRHAPAPRVGTNFRGAVLRTEPGERVEMSEIPMICTSDVHGSGRRARFTCTCTPDVHGSGRRARFTCTCTRALWLGWALLRGQTFWQAPRTAR
jgi:hypothetical protein